MATISKSLIDTRLIGVYNPSLLKSSTGGLTQAQADVLYASKLNPVITGKLFVVGDEEISETMIFGEIPAVKDNTIVPTDEKHLVPKKYVDEKNTFTRINVVDTLSNYNTGITNITIPSSSHYNVALGYGTKIGAFCDNNTFVGYGINTNNNIAVGCTLIGHATGFSTTNPYQYSTALGRGVIISANNQVAIGTASETTLIQGNLTVNKNVILGSNNTNSISVLGNASIGTNYNTITNINGTINLGTGTGQITYDATNHQFNQVPKLTSSLGNTDITDNKHLITKEYCDSKISTSGNTKLIYSLGTKQFWNGSTYTLQPPYFGQSGVSNGQTTKSFFINYGSALGVGEAFGQLIIPLKITHILQKSTNSLFSSLSQSARYLITTSSANLIYVQSEICIIINTSGATYKVINGTSSFNINYDFNNGGSRASYNFFDSVSLDPNNNRVQINYGIPRFYNDPTSITSWITSISCTFELTGNISSNWLNSDIVLSNGSTNTVYLSSS